MRRTAFLAAALFVCPSVVAPVGAAAAAPTCDGRAATIVGTSGSDSVQGTDGDDVAVLLGGGDYFSGGLGNDIVCGGADGDTLEGGDGSDRLFGEGGLDVISLDAGDDVVSGGASEYDELTFQAAPHGVQVNLSTGTAEGWGHDKVLGGFEILRGSSWNDVMVGTDADEMFFGLGGEDRIVARGGEDDIEIERGSVDGGAGHDYGVIRGTAAVHGGPDADSFVVSGGSPTVWGEGGDDDFTVENDATPRIFGGAGWDALDLTERTGRVVLDLADHSGNIPAGSLEIVEGTRFADVLRGADGHQELWGMGGDDRLVGRGGRDFLYGNGGHDMANGGAGPDVCRTEVRSGC